MADKNFIPSPSSPPPDMSLPVVREIIEMRLCEASHVVLHPDRLYRFSVAPGCRSCEMEAGIIPRPVIPASRAPGGPFPRTVTCAWCGNRYRSSCPGEALPNE